jgi:hypothetical protein
MHSKSMLKQLDNPQDWIWLTPNEAKRLGAWRGSKQPVHSRISGLLHCVRNDDYTTIFGKTLNKPQWNEAIGDAEKGEAIGSLSVVAAAKRLPVSGRLLKDLTFDNFKRI